MNFNLNGKFFSFQQFQVSVSGACSASSLRRNSSINLKEPYQPPLLLGNNHQLPTTSLQPQTKRTRLSSSVNLSSSQQLSPLQSIEIAVKRSKRESHPFNLNEIFLQNLDVDYMSVWLSFAQIFNTVPTNFLSYLAEWSSATIDLVKDRTKGVTGTMSSEALDRIPNKLLGINWTPSQINIYLMFILLGCVDILNFSVFLFYQFRSCTLLRIDFNKFLLRFPFFRPFVKPISSNGGRNRLNSTSLGGGRLSTSAASGRRASKI